MRRRSRLPFALAVAVMLLGGWASAEASPAVAGPATVDVLSVSAPGAPAPPADILIGD